MSPRINTWIWVSKNKIIEKRTTPWQLFLILFLDLWRMELPSAQLCKLDFWSTFPLSSIPSCSSGYADYKSSMSACSSGQAIIQVPVILFTWLLFLSFEHLFFGTIKFILKRELCICKTRKEINHSLFCSWHWVHNANVMHYCIYCEDACDCELECRDPTVM